MSEQALPRRADTIGRMGWWHTLKRTVTGFRDDNLTDSAAALTYYGLLALFPALIVLVAILGLAGRQPETTNALLDIVEQAGSPQAAEAVRGPIEGVIASRAGAGSLLGVGLLGALWSASGFVGAFGRASNRIWEVEEGRPIWKWKPLQILITVTMVLLVAVVALGLVVTGPLTAAIGDAVGLSDAATLAWSIAKWPVMLLIMMVAIAFLYFAAPNVRQPKFTIFSPGAAVAILVWIVASVLFAVYVANFGSYNKTYGSLGGAIVLLVWMWISNCALLLGAKFNAELERERELAAGVAARKEIRLPERDPADD